MTLTIRVSCYEFDTIAERIGGKGSIEARNRFRIALHFDAGGMQRLEKLREIRDQQRRMSFLGGAKVSFDAEVQLQGTTLKPATAASNKRRVLPAKQRAQAEPTSPVAPMTRRVSQSSGRPSRRAARSMPRTINAAVSVLPVVRMSLSTGGWAIASSRIEVNPPSVASRAPSRSAALIPSRTFATRCRVGPSASSLGVMNVSM
jgi:hypothetical protein